MAAKRVRKVTWEPIGGVDAYVARVDGKLWPVGVRAVGRKWEAYDPVDGESYEYYDGPRGGWFRTAAEAKALSEAHMGFRRK